MTRLAFAVWGLMLAATPSVGGEPPKVDPAAVARQILDDTTPGDRRTALIRDNATLAPELLTAMTTDLQPGAEEYRRIPWVWRVAIAAGRRNDADQLRRLLEVSLPKSGAALCDWQAVVVGGGLINGVSLEGKWPGKRFEELLKGHDTLAERWRSALKDAHRMADDTKVPTGTRYDALRMIALDAWAASEKRLTAYLKKDADAELQMGAVSGLSDVDRPEAATLLVDGLRDLTAANRKLAIDALLRTEPRKELLRKRLTDGSADTSWLSDTQRKALGS